LADVSEVSGRVVYDGSCGGLQLNVGKVRSQKELLGDLEGVGREEEVGVAGDLGDWRGQYFEGVLWVREGL
jgi:hypothetical protein